MIVSRHSDTYDVLGVSISVTDPAHAATTIIDWANDDVGRFVCIRDVASLMTIVDDPAISQLHEHASMITPDGAPIALIGKMKGYPVQRTCGPDLMELVCRMTASSNISHYFFGGKEGVAQELADKLLKKYPGLKIAGYECPPFNKISASELSTTRERLRTSGADIVWVGMSSPKQDVWMFENYRYLSMTLIGIGAAFDFHTGNVKRAPVWMQRLMLEWAYRLVSEPRRLWRRYLVLAPRFVGRVLWGAFGKGQSLS